MTIKVRLDRQVVPIEKRVFTTLLDNSVAGTYAAYENALENGYIRFSELVRLSRRGDFPYTLFFAPFQLVETQVDTKIKKLLDGLNKDTFAINSRAEVELRDVELIVKDLIRKQELLKKHDKTLHHNKIIGLLRRPGRSPEADGQKFMSTLGWPSDQLRSVRTKEAALDLLIDRLEANQILVSRSVRNYMPQILDNVRFSGMTIRDNKVPYIFLAGGDHKDAQEPVGRTIFTLTLLTVLIARKIFAPMTWDGGSVGSEVSREYDIAAAMLLPADQLKSMDPWELDDMKAAADYFKVTPSAVVVRAMRLGIINTKTAQSHLDELELEYLQRPKQRGWSQIRPENAVRKYNGREFSSRMLEVFDAGGITPGDFYRAVCLNHINERQLGDLRIALS